MIQSVYFLPNGNPEPMPEAGMATGRTVVWGGGPPVRFAGLSGGGMRETVWEVQVSGLDAATYDLSSTRHGLFRAGQPLPVKPGETFDITLGLRGATDRVLPFSVSLSEGETPSGGGGTASPTGGRPAARAERMRRELLWVPPIAPEDFGVRIASGEMIVRPWTKKLTLEVITANLSGFSAAMRPRLLAETEGVPPPDPASPSRPEREADRSVRLDPLHQQSWECQIHLGGSRKRASTILTADSLVSSQGGGGGGMAAVVGDGVNRPGGEGGDNLKVPGLGSFYLLYKPLLRAFWPDWPFFLAGAGTLLFLLVQLLLPFRPPLPDRIVPDLTNKTLVEAQRMAAHDGFLLSPQVSRGFSDTVEAGKIYKTDPGPSTHLTPTEWKKMRVAVWLSRGVDVVEVPDIASPSHPLTLAQAEAKLKARGLRTDLGDEEWNSIIPKGHVIRSTPEGGAKVAPGAHVAVTLSRGAEPKAPTPTPEPSDPVLPTEPEEKERPGPSPDAPTDPPVTPDEKPTPPQTGEGL